MNTIIIDSTITLAAPLSIAMPVAQGGRPNQYNNFPVTAVGQDDEGNPVQTGYLPASTVRGFVRREAGLSAARERGTSTLQQMYSDILGQRADTREETDLQALEALREGDPILDLFGSWSVRSRLLVSNFVPTFPVLPQAVTGVRKDLEDTLGALDFLGETDREAYFSRSDTNADRAAADAVLTKLRRELAKARKAGSDLADLTAAVEAQEESVSKLKEQMGDMANSSRTITEYYALPQGTVMEGRIVIERAKERDLPMLLSALDALSRRPLLGAQVARGCGEIEGRFTVKVDGVVQKVVTVGGWEPARVTDFSAVEQAEVVS